MFTMDIFFALWILSRLCDSKASVPDIRVITDNNKSQTTIHFRQPQDKEKQWSYRCSAENREGRCNLKI